MKRWLSNFMWLTLVILLLCAIFVWVRSYLVQDDITHVGMHKEINISSDRGSLWVATLWGPDWQLSGGQWQHSAGSPGKYLYGPETRLGFFHERGSGPGAGLGYRIICIPLWFVTSVL